MTATGLVAEERVSWYAVGIFFSLLTPSLLYVWNGCCGNACSGLHSLLFKIVAERFYVEEHRFDGVGNLGAMSRVLRQAGLRTGRHRWNHDANADSGDSVQVGTVRLPTKSYSLWLLALLGITHYIWMKDDGSVIVMTAPRDAVDVLVRISNSAVNRQATDAEITELMSVFVDGPMEEKCRLLDRLLAATALGIAALFLGFSRSMYLNVIGLLVGAPGGAAICYYILGLRGWRVMDCKEWIWTHTRLLLWRFGLDATVSVDASSVELVGAEDTATHESNATVSVDASSVREKRYCLVVARVAWYEIHCQLPFRPDVFRDLPAIDMHTGVKALAMPHTGDLPQITVHCLSHVQELLYVCVHNPMVDLHILEMRELLVKATKDIVLVIILPTCEHFSTSLENPPAARLHAHKDSRFVATLADMSCWLTMLSTGVFSKVLLVLPYLDREKMQDSSLWTVIKHTVDSEIVHPSRSAGSGH
jgi:hypothetical protein